MPSLPAQSLTDLDSDASRPRVLVTAGPTQEPVDAVRFIGNRSSGRMGIAIATESAARGWPTTLLLGPVDIPPPGDVDTQRFKSGSDLDRLMQDTWPDHDILIMAAAVCDFVPISTGPGKLSRRDGPMTLSLEPAPDLLAKAAASSRKDQTLIGFALEATEDLRTRGLMKLGEKGLHALVANPLETLESDSVDAILLTRDAPERIAPPGLAKEAFAPWLLDEVMAIHNARITASS